MDISLPLDKIAMMEKIWDDLCRDPETIPSPAWHQDVLTAREKAINEGRASFTSFDRVKERIRVQHCREKERVGRIFS
jgi:putative addiction module component (TIGR02574 family)